MKIFVLLLSMLVLSLTALPCCSQEEVQGDRNEQEVAGHKGSKANGHSEKEEGCCKDCSPFYVCGTCSGFTICAHSLITFAVYLKPIQHNTGYIHEELPSICLSFWQPPKLA